MRTCTYLHTYLHIYIFTVNYKYFSFILAKGAIFVCFVQKYFVKVWNCWFEKFGIAGLKSVAKENFGQIYIMERKWAIHKKIK